MKGVLRRALKAGNELVVGHEGGVGCVSQPGSLVVDDARDFGNLPAVPIPTRGALRWEAAVLDLRAFEQIEWHVPGAWIGRWVLRERVGKAVLREQHVAPTDRPAGLDVGRLHAVFDLVARVKKGRRIRAVVAREVVADQLT